MEKLSDRTIDALNANLRRLAQPLWQADSPVQKEIEAFVAHNPGLGVLILPFLQQGAQAHMQMLTSYMGLLALLGVKDAPASNAKRASEDFLKRFFSNDKTDAE